MFAVVKTGGKQYRVAPDDLLTVERLPGNAGDTIALDQVLMLSSDKGLEVGSPLLNGVAVGAEIVEQKRGDKIIIFKKKRRHNYRRKNGHRQELTVLRITSIGDAVATKAAKPAATTAPQTVKTKSKDTGGKDDLKKISGVGPKLEEKLNDLGYTTFQQIADMTPQEIEEVDEKLNFKGRIERDNWLDQARQFIAEAGDA
ncbi:MAG: 50S ribosomal protein L21 [Pseudomonadota bacterium]